MKAITRCLFTTLFIVLCACSGSDHIPAEIMEIYPESLTVTAINSLNEELRDAAVFLDVRTLRESVPDFNPGAYVVWSRSEELPSQVVDEDEGKIIVLANFAPNEKKRLTIYYKQDGEVIRNYPKRTQAELSHKVGGKFVDRVYEGGAFQNVSFLCLPPEHTDHSFFIRYEGPGWESDRVGYRFYLDWRNATDIFGKKIPDMVLQNVGQDGFDSYHEMSDWGMDVLKVGDALGIGSIGMWLNGKAQRVSVTDSVTCKIIADGPVFSQIRTSYYGWAVGDSKYDLISDFAISAGKRITWHGLKVRGDPENLCTGLVQHEDAVLIQSDTENGWAYLASWGQQSLAGDNLGMAVFYHTDDLIRITEDGINHVVILQSKDGRLMYGFAAAWEQEPDGIVSEKAFVDYLEDTIKRLNAPLQIKF